MKFYRQNPNLVTIGQKCRASTWRTKHLLWLQVRIIRYKAALCNSQYVYIFASDVQFKNTHRTHCCLSIATMVTWTRPVNVIHMLPILQKSSLHIIFICHNFSLCFQKNY